MAKQIFTHDHVYFTDELNPRKKVRTIRQSEITGQAVKSSHYAIKRNNTKYIYEWDIFTPKGNVMQSVCISRTTTIHDERIVIANHILNLDNKTNKQI